MIDQAATYLKQQKVPMWELYYTKTNSTTLILQKEKTDFASQGEDEALAVRIFMNGKMGFASTMRLDQYTTCVDQAIKIAKLNNPDKNFKHFPYKEKLPKMHPADKKLLALPITAMHTITRDYIQSIKDVNKNIKSTSLNYERDISTSRILNSEGIDAETMVAANSLGGELMLGKESCAYGYEEKTPLDSGRGTEHAERLTGIANGKRITTQTIPLLLHPDAFASLLQEAFTFAINAENVQLKKSLFTGKIGKKLFDTKLTIEDNALNPKYYMSRPFDDEGAPSQDLPIVTKGVLKNYIYDSYTAHVAGKKSTGHAHRGALTTPGIAPNNILISPGTKKLNDLLPTLKKAIYVKQLLGTHTMQDATGDFSLGVYEGQYIENGTIKHGVKDTMIAGNLFTLLKNITALSKETEHAGHGYYLPHTIFPAIKVIGEN